MVSSWGLADQGCPPSSSGTGLCHAGQLPARLPDTLPLLHAPQAIGKGAYGVVCSAKNTVSGEKVAIKKIGNAFENLTDARRTLREIKLLRHLRHENIIGVRDIMKASRDRFNDVYLVYELMDTDLHQIIRSSQPLTNEHFQYFIYQVPAHSRGLCWERGPAGGGGEGVVAGVGCKLCVHVQSCWCMYLLLLLPICVSRPHTVLSQHMPPPAPPCAPSI